MSLWMHHLLPWLLIPMTIIPGFWMALGGVALRRMARRYPLALAVPAGAVEVCGGVVVSSPACFLSMTFLTM